MDCKKYSFAEFHQALIKAGKPNTLGYRYPFTRESVALRPGDQVVCILPNFRADVAREFTFEEVNAAGFSASLINIYEVTP